MGSVLRSRIDTRSDEYQRNLAAMQALWDEVAGQLAARSRRSAASATSTATEPAARCSPASGSRRSSIRDTPLLELSPLAGWGSEFPIGAGVVNAIGVVEGVECAISATDMTYRGGSMNPRSVDKGQRFQEIVRANRLPWISLNESAGADLPYQADIFIRGGAGFKNQTQLSKLGVPTITVGFGPATAGGAYTPGHERLHGVRQGPRHRAISAARRW